MFGAIKITKDVNTSHYQYHGYGICFDGKSDFSFGNTTNGKNVIIFGADMSFSSHSTNKANNIYVLEKDFVQGINGTIICAEKIYKHNFTTPNKKFVFSLLRVGNMSSDWSSTESTKTGLHGNVYDFALDYLPLNGVKTIYDIRWCLMKKHGIV